MIATVIEEIEGYERTVLMILIEKPYIVKDMNVFVYDQVARIIKTL